MVKTNWSEEAISPVISIVLIVAVVVILAAVVGTVALGTIGGTQGNSKSVHLTASKGSSGITFTVQGGADLPSVTSLDIVNGNTITNCTGASPKIGTTFSGSTDSTGRSVVVASFTDGSKQVVFDKNWGTAVQCGSSSSSSAGDYQTITMSMSFDGTNYLYTWVYGPYGPKYYDAVYYYYQNGASTGTANPEDVPPGTYTNQYDSLRYTSYKIVAVVGGVPVATLLDWSAPT
jgi:FlaG/FlaF family flagellin (archaellin)